MPEYFPFRFLTFAIMHGGVISTLVRRPLNVAIVQDSAVTLRCSSDARSSFIQWYDNGTCAINEHLSNCRQYLIYGGGSIENVPQTFSVTKVDNATHVTRDLIINKAQLTHAGVYLCIERVSAGDEQISVWSSAQLIVLANDPQCSWNLSSSGVVREKHVIMMTCNITYSGNWAPVMRWFNSVTRYNYSDDVTSFSTNDVTTVTSQLTVAASTGLHGSEIVCVTYFTKSSTALPTSATNIPSYANKWTSPTLDVHYAPRNLQIISRQSTYKPGDRIQCSAEGNPEPSYQWRDLVNGTVIERAFLIIVEKMVDSNHTFQCTASNQYNNMSSNLTFAVEGLATDSSTVQSNSHAASTGVTYPGTVATTAKDANGGMTVLIAAIVGGVGLLLIIIIIVVVVLVCRKRRKKSGSEDKKIQSNSEATTPSAGIINDGSTEYENIDLTEPNGHSAQRPTQDRDATTNFQTEESPYDAVVARPGPVPRSRPPGSAKNKLAQPEPTYVAIDHNKKVTSK